MNRTDEHLSEREEIEMLLPWYVTGRLDAADTARVAAYLERHPDVRSQFPLVRDEQMATVAGNEAIQARLPSAEMLVAQTATPSQMAASWLSRVLDGARSLVTAPTPRAVRWAGAAAAVVILVQAIALGTLLTRDAPRFGTASGPAIEMVQTSATIAFADGVSATQIARFLSEHRLRIVDGPLPGGFFGVRFEDEATADEVQRRLSAVAARKDVVKALLPGR